MEGVSIFAFGPSARAAQQPRKRDEQSIAKSQNAQRTAHAERTRPHVQKSSFLGAESSPKSTPRLPKATPEACGSGWLANSAKIRDQEHPRDASKGFQVPPAGNETFAGGSRLPVSRKLLNNNSTRDLTRRWAAGPANLFNTWPDIVTRASFGVNVDGIDAENHEESKNKTQT